MNRRHHLRVPVLLSAALATLLVFASPAAAETFTGESTTIAQQSGAPTPETTLVKASVFYDSTVGKLSLDAETAAPPQPVLGTEPNASSLRALFMSIVRPCTVADVEAGLNGEGGISIFSEAVFQSAFGEPTTAEGALTVPISPIPVQKTVSGSTTSFTAQRATIREQEFNCAMVVAEGPEQSGATSMVFPLTPLPPPPPVLAPPAPPATPAPPSPVLSIAKRKPLTLKVGEWKTVKLKVTNIGSTGTAQGSLRVKAPKGVSIRPEMQQLPALAPGASWTVSVRLELTKKAKKKSTLSLTAAASGVTGKGSLVLKLKKHDSPGLPGLS